MKQTALLAMLLCGLITATSSVAQTLYKFVGPDGRITYSDKPPATSRSEKTIKFDSPPSSALPATTFSYVEQLRKKKGGSSANVMTSSVVLYSASWCDYCKQAKAYLTSKGITYQEIDIDTEDGMTAYTQAGGGNGVPLLVAGGQSIQGFSPASYDALFSNRKSVR